jgi:hypothetical protein
MSDNDDVYLIWSHEHGAWWRDGGHGYTRSLAEAGRTDRAHALHICANAIPATAARHGALPELPVRLADVEMMRDRFRGTYPGTPRESWE